MAQDGFKPRGTLKASKPDAGGANIRSVPVLGIVKDNIDPTRAGRLQVYISDFSGQDPDNRDNWVTVSYLSPFYGRVTPKAGDTGFGSYKANPSSYGMWQAPPDIGSTVVCLFVNGDMNYGFYIGCVPEPEALHMVPAIGANQSNEDVIFNPGEAQSYGGAIRVPVTNMNTNNEGLTNKSDYITSPKPVHSYVAGIMNQQGVIRDPIRGPISSSAQRETPSRVGWGVSTPGRPIYEGGFDDASVAKNLDPSKNQQLRVVARRGGHSIVMDDGDVIGRDQLIRIRTALGHQILMSDDGQTLMLLHSNGQSYIELGKEGTIDMYSTNSVNIRTQGDLNLHADRNINMHAAKEINMQSEQMRVNTEKEFLQKTGTNYKLFTLGQFTSKVDKQMSFESGGDSSFASKSITYINGSKINLNTGATSLIPQDVKPIPLVAHTDTLYDKIKGFAAAPGKLLSITSRAPAHAPWANAGQGVDVKIDLGASAQLPQPPAPAIAAVNKTASTGPITAVTAATTSTVPAAAAVSKAIDKNTTTAVVGAIATAAATGPTAAAVKAGAGVVQTATGAVASVGALAQTPAELEKSGFLKPGSANLVANLVASGSNVQSAMTSNLFTGKAGGENLEAFIKNTTVQTAAQVTNLQQAQAELQKAGVITGNEAPMQVAGLVMAGAKVGVDATVGAVKNIASVGSLTNTATSVGSAITATVNGVTNIASTIGAAGAGIVGGAAGLAANALTSTVNTIAGASSAVMSAIGSGNFAAGLAQSVTGGLGGVTQALNSMAKIQGVAGLIDATKGIAGSAFAAITNSFTPFQAGVPQNLKSIADAAAVANAAASAAGGGGGNILNSLAGIGNAAGAAVNAVAGATSLAGAATAVGSAVNTAFTTAGNNISNTLRLNNPATAAASVANATAAVGALAGASSVLGATNSTVNQIGAVAGAVSTVTNSVGALASGISNLPGGQQTVSSVINTAAGAAAALVPGTQALGSVIKNASAAAMNGLSNPASLLPNVGSLASLVSAGLPAGAAAQLNSAISSLSAGGSVPIKMPTVALNTTNRSDITAQIGSVFGDPGIPQPNLGGEVPAFAEAAVEEEVSLSKQVVDAVNEFNRVQKLAEYARDAYYKAKKELPAGDPELERLKKEWFAILDGPEWKAADAKLAALQRKIG